MLPFKKPGMTVIKVPEESEEDQHLGMISEEILNAVKSNSSHDLREAIKALVACIEMYDEQEDETHEGLEES